MQENKNIDTGTALWTPTRVAQTVLVLSLVAAFGVSSCSSSDERRPEPPATGVAKNESAPPVRNVAPAPAPPPLVVMLPPSVANAELQAVAGAPIKLSSYAGKVVLVNLWATWCTPCRMETPELVKLYKEFRTQGLEVVGLSTEDPDSSAESVKRFIQDYDVKYRIGWASPEVSITLMQGRDSIPQSFVISRTGRVVKRFVGFNAVQTPPLIKEAIQQALNEKAAAD